MRDRQPPRMLDDYVTEFPRERSSPRTVTGISRRVINSVSTTKPSTSRSMTDLNTLRNADTAAFGQTETVNQSDSEQDQIQLGQSALSMHGSRRTSVCKSACSSVSGKAMIALFKLQAYVTHS